jgi:hypothetical protein
VGLTIQWCGCAQCSDGREHARVGVDWLFEERQQPMVTVAAEPQQHW